MVAKEKTPKAPKAKKASKAKAPKPKKPKKLSILDTELDRLKLAEQTLEKLIEAKQEADEREMEAELASERAKDKKAAYREAKGRITELIEAYRRPLPLFDQKPAEVKPEEKPAECPVVKLPTVKIIGGYDQHGLAVDGEYSVCEIKPGGLIVMAGETPIAVADAECTADESVKALIAKARQNSVFSKPQWLQFLADSQPKPAEKDAWMKLSITELGLSPDVEDFTIRAGIQTLGDFQQHQKRHGDFWAKDLKVADTKKPRGYEEAVLAGWHGFWQSHPEFCAA